MLKRRFCLRGHDTIICGRVNRRCRTCQHEQLKRAINAGKLLAYRQAERNTKLKQAYGINLVDYNKLFKAQNGRCAICQRHQREFTRALCVDHDHKTKKVRGLLCHYCNTSLGNFNDNTDLLRSAITYLEDK